MILKNETVFTDEDGIVHHRSKTFRTKVKTEAFYATYLKQVGVLYEMTATELKMMIYLCQKARHDTGEVDITPADRAKMMAFFGVKTSAITNNLKNLVKKEILIGAKGSYVINPLLFWKGSFDSRERLLQTSSFEIKLSIVDDTSE